jgi:hypothetical protein
MERLAQDFCKYLILFNKAKNTSAQEMEQNSKNSRLRAKTVTQMACLVVCLLLQDIQAIFAIIIIITICFTKRTGIK